MAGGFSGLKRRNLPPKTKCDLALNLRHPAGTYTGYNSNPWPAVYFRSPSALPGKIPCPYPECKTRHRACGQENGNPFSSQHNQYKKQNNQRGILRPVPASTSSSTRYDFFGLQTWLKSFFQPPTSNTRALSTRKSPCSGNVSVCDSESALRKKVSRTLPGLSTFP